MEMSLDPNRKLMIYPNQIQTAKEVIDGFENKSIILQMVLGKCQSGKTGTMLAIIKEFLERNIVIPVENIYIITGLSSRDWKNQTKSRFPLRIQQRGFHRSDLPKGFKEDLLNKKIV
jgi:superfamily II DNA or RNA helicase